MRKPSKEIFKGGSSSSNPRVTKFRDQVQNPAPQPQGNRGLSEKQLKAHESTQQGEEDEDLETKIFSVRPSNNVDVIFAPVQRYWHSPAQQHREICAVYAAVSEAIREKNMERSTTAYFGALISTLESSKVGGEEASVTAILYLLTLVFPRVSEGVLASRFGYLAALLKGVIDTFSKPEKGQALLKSCLLCLGVLLSRVSDPAVWEASSTVEYYRLVLRFALDKRAKLRKAACSCITHLVAQYGGADGGRGGHPVIKLSSSLFSGLKTSEGIAGSVFPHTLTLLQSVIAHLPSETQTSLAKLLPTLIKSGEPINFILVLNVFQSLFENTDPSLSSFTPHSLTAVLNALLRFKPAVKDASQRVHFVKALTPMFVFLAKLPSGLDVCLGMLSSYVAFVSEQFAFSAVELVQNAVSSISTLIDECIGPAHAQIELAVARHADLDTPLHDIIKSFSSLLRFRYQVQYPVIMGLLARLFRALGRRSYPLLGAIVVELVKLHDMEGMNCASDIESALGEAITAMGPRHFVILSPLDLDSEEAKSEFEHAWLLPLLAKYIKNAELGFFSEYFLPLANKLYGQQMELSSAGEGLLSKMYETLSLQIWQLLPAFCDSPSDVRSGFKAMARSLGTLLTDREDLCLVVCTSLRKLITTAAEGDRPAIATFAKNFLPLLFNLYTSSGHELKGPLLETIKAYVSIADHTLLQTFFENIFASVVKLGLQAEGGDVEEMGEETSQRDMMDLLVVLVPYLDLASIERLYRVIKPQMQNASVSLQKKAYRALSSLCESSSHIHVAFIRAHCDDLREQLIESWMSSNPTVRFYRLKCLLSVAQKLEAAHLLTFVPSIITEVVVSTKEVNARAREEAFVVLVSLGQCFIDVDGDRPLFPEYIKMLMAGFAGTTPHMISATLNALTKICSHFRHTVDLETVHSVIDVVLMLLQSRAREVVKSALNFIKVMLSALPKHESERHVGPLIAAMTSAPEDIQHYFTTEIKVLFDRLIRKFGFETIKELTPEAHQKRINNIRKHQERAKRKKEKGEETPMNDEEEGKKKGKEKGQDSDGEDSDGSYDDYGSDEEDDFQPLLPEGTSKKKTDDADLWLKDDAEDPLDFMDPDSNRHIGSGARESRASTSEKKRVPFKMDDEGRFVITDPDSLNKKRKLAEEPAPVGSRKAVFAEKVRMVEGAQKMEKEEEEEEGIDFGTGIHRDRAKRKKVIEVDSDDEDGKADEKDEKASSKPGLGAEYRSKKAGGDIIRKGKPLPYAYIPLQKSQLNKRKKSKTEGQIKGLLKGIKKAREQTRRVVKSKDSARKRGSMRPKNI